LIANIKAITIDTQTLVGVASSDALRCSHPVTHHLDKLDQIHGVIAVLKVLWVMVIVLVVMPLALAQDLLVPLCSPLKRTLVSFSAASLLRITQNPLERTLSRRGQWRALGGQVQIRCLMLDLVVGYVVDITPASAGILLFGDYENLCDYLFYMNYTIYS
jgi:hypothetical protein